MHIVSVYFMMTMGTISNNHRWISRTKAAQESNGHQLIPHTKRCRSRNHRWIPCTRAAQDSNDHWWIPRTNVQESPVNSANKSSTGLQQSLMGFLTKTARECKGHRWIPHTKRHMGPTVTGGFPTQKRHRSPTVTGWFPAQKRLRSPIITGWFPIQKSHRSPTVTGGFPTQSGAAVQIIVRFLAQSGTGLQWSLMDSPHKYGRRSHRWILHTKAAQESKGHWWFPSRKLHVSPTDTGGFPTHKNRYMFWIKDRHK